MEKTEYFIEFYIQSQGWTRGQFVRYDEDEVRADKKRLDSNKGIAPSRIVRVETKETVLDETIPKQSINSSDERIN